MPLGSLLKRMRLGVWSFFFRVNLNLNQTVFAWLRPTYSPLISTILLQQRRIRSHLHHVAVPLHPNHEHGFRDGALHDRLRELRPVVHRDTRVLADEIRKPSIDVVEFIEHADHLSRRRVRVPIHPDARRFWVRQVFVRAGDDGQLWVFGMDGVVEGREALGVGRSPAVQVILVADFDVTKGPGAREAVRGAKFAVAGAGVAEDVLDNKLASPNWEERFCPAVIIITSSSFKTSSI
jgi:hypothetical protein